MVACSSCFRRPWTRRKRLWDMETNACLKLFAHSNYVTCIQFNPMEDDYFISGSLDSKVRIWSMAERHVVDWSDLNDMVTAACVGGIGVKTKTWLTSSSYEHFFCRDVSAAVPLPGSPSFRCADRSPSSVHGHGGGKKQEPSCAVDDVQGSMPRRPKSGPMTYPVAGGQVDLCREASSRGRHDGAEGGNAWGMVAVAASLEGEIRVYQNFGLPLKIRGHSNLFHG